MTTLFRVGGCLFSWWSLWMFIRRKTDSMGMSDSIEKIISTKRQSIETFRFCFLRMVITRLRSVTCPSTEYITLSLPILRKPRLIADRLSPAKKIETILWVFRLIIPIGKLLNTNKIIWNSLVIWLFHHPCPCIQASVSNLSKKTNTMRISFMAGINLLRRGSLK